MYSALQITEYFVRKAIKDGCPVSVLKVMKMVYIAHGYYLAQKGKALIEEDIEAWKHGPVIPEVYHFYKKYGREPIEEENSVGVILLEDDFRTRRVLDKVYDKYITKSASQLVSLTHKIGSPWHETCGGRVNSSGIVIENETIKNYYLSEMDSL